MRHALVRSPAGFTLVEMLIALVVAGTLVAIAVPPLVRLRSAATLNGAADAVARQLALGRNLAIARREPVRLRAGPAGTELHDPEGNVLVALRLGRGEELPIDSLRVRPAAIRFNERGQAGAGSVYLWKDDRGVRLVCNFLGRVRRESLP
ncbi:MAG: prepilin-type N-terminal cleavage/methylation domain-containing protein [Gemmatimonadota bacterium]|nr:prepilin-type N-terminal cleavage/methylation domain-containing protein [Gemmatimonadota bacterium]